MIVYRSAVLVITAAPIAVSKHAAALFRHGKFILLQVCLTGGQLVFAFLLGKSLELAALDLVTLLARLAGDLSSTIANFFDPLTTRMIVGDKNPAQRSWSLQN